MAVGGKVQEIRSSLPYHVLLYCNGWYFGLFFIAELLIFVFKGETLPFPSGALTAEVILIFILGGLEMIRLFFGKKGNLTEHNVALIMSILISIPSLMGAIYLLVWQTYVLRIELILSAIQITFIGLQFIFAVISLITFARAQ